MKLNLLFLSTLIALALASTDEPDAGSCSNAALIGPKNTNYASKGCVRSRSKGFRSSHNCAAAGGRAYLCVQNNVVTCISGKANVISANLENGECFI